MAKLTLTDISAGYDTVSLSSANNTLIESALENTLSRDGTAPNQMGAALDMNSNKINNLTDGTNNQDAITLSQLNAASVVASTIAGTGVTIADAGGYYTATTAEAVLQEIGAEYADRVAGSFTATLTGCTTSPTVTLTYSIWDSKNVILTMDVLDSLSATSNTTAMTITGLPAAITSGTAGARSTCLVVDNGSVRMAYADLAAAGTTLTFYVADASGDFSATGFTSSGTKGLSSKFSLYYTLD